MIIGQIQTIQQLRFFWQKNSKNRSSSHLIPDKNIFLRSNKLIMKHFTILFLFVINSHFCSAQNNPPCTGHPLFTAMINHTPWKCEVKEFDEMEIYQKDKVKGRIEFKKQGLKNKVSYKFTGDANQRPSDLQITQNFVNAIKKAGGEILYQAENYLYGKIKKNNAVYWIGVDTDGTGVYTIVSIKEEQMKQDVAMTADEIKGNLKEDGKAVFYGIYFNTGEAILKAESAPTLIQIAAYLKGNATVNVYIVGHTDNVGDFNKNLLLSKNRATAVADELANKYGVNKNRLTAQGVGPLAPISGNKSEEGKARNRRVEMVLK